MTLVNKTIPNLYGGVSQQPASLRLLNQLEEMENCYATIVDGIAKRQHRKHVAVLTGSKATKDSYVHYINRDLSERYIVVITDDPDNPIEVYTRAGVQCTVNYDTGAKAYLSGTAIPKLRFKSVTVADHTFIVNREKTCAMAADLTPGAIEGSYQTLSKLPTTVAQAATSSRAAVPIVVENAIYEVRGDDNSNFDRYFVKYLCATAGDIKTGTYNEWVKPGVKYKFDASTMPHKLARTGVNTFTFGPITWGERAVGDETTAAEPSFIGDQIQNVTFHKNRLAFMTRTNLVLSKAGEYFDFWPSTVIDTLDDDPIDIGVHNGEDTTNLQAAIPFEKSLVIFSEMQQYIITSGDSPMTAKTVAATPTTAFPLARNSQPVKVGSNVYFPSPSGGYISIREYMVNPDSLVDDAADVTAHVPRYIPEGSLTTLVAVNNLDLVLVHSTADPAALYVYKFYWNGTTKAQSCWGRWSFDGDVIGLAQFDTDLDLIVQRGSEVSLESIQLTPLSTGSLPFRVALDRLTTVTGVYDADTKRTTWTLPYAVDASLAGKLRVVDTSTGLAVDAATMPTTTTVQAPGDFSGAPHYIGIVYDSYFDLSEWYLKSATKDTVILSANVKSRRITLSFTNTGYFKVIVTPPKRESMTSEFTGAIIGSVKVGEVPLVTREWKFPVLGSTVGLQVRILNDSYLPSTFQALAWEGIMTLRSKAL